MEQTKKYTIQDFHSGQLPDTERDLVAVLHEEMVTLSNQLTLITKKINILSHAIEAIRIKHDTDYIKNIQPQITEAGYSNVITLNNQKPCGCKDSK